MLNIQIGKNGSEIKVVAGGEIADISADILCSLTIIYEQIEKNYGKCCANQFLELIKDNIDYAKDKDALHKKVTDEISKMSEDEINGRMKELLKEISELEEDIKKLKEEIKTDDK